MPRPGEGAITDHRDDVIALPLQGQCWRCRPPGEADRGMGVPLDPVMWLRFMAVGILIDHIASAQRRSLYRGR